MHRLAVILSIAFGVISAALALSWYRSAIGPLELGDVPELILLVGWVAAPFVLLALVGHGMRHWMDAVAVLSVSTLLVGVPGVLEYYSEIGLRRPVGGMLFQVVPGVQLAAAVGSIALAVLIRKRRASRPSGDA